MELPQRKIWLNFLSLLPSTLLSVLTIAVAFLRFYDQEDFTFLAIIEQPREASNRLTVAALVVALVAFGVEWDRRNRETARQEAETARAENERAEERERAAEERERAARRARIQNRGTILQIRYQIEPNEANGQALRDFLAFLQEYGE
ncbi:hypothetical protein [Dactylococcopsis salina]|uniref:Uncharacterized protein n=1 Tax=Dactylococcopsis salina (strain PCC 8305) TaxID=13035 RepID=K9YRV7_DACS8|nr:hypothetical protein [Dactylococcopsis salina]AFZ49100.1 hypothetical protein Dacsa_0296 [Dactylococcopsis salina PCC 8305]